MLILKWYSIFVILLMLASLVFSKGTKPSTVVIGGLMLLPVLAYIAMGVS